MPLGPPLNDRQCLGKLHERVLEYKDTERAQVLAAQFPTIDELIEFIRELRQRDDFGNPRDGPRIACDVSQRLRLPAWDPNCFERLATFLALALIIDPDNPQIALQNIHLSIKQPDHSKNPPPGNPTRKRPSSLIRRMTLAFRPPTRERNN